MIMKTISDYYYDYDTKQYITIRIMGDNCEICQDKDTRCFWGVVNSPKLYISKGNNKFVPMDVHSTTEMKIDRMKKVCDCKLYDDFVLPLVDKEKFDTTHLRLVKMGDGVSMNIIKYRDMEVMSEGHSQGFF